MHPVFALLQYFFPLYFHDQICLIGRIFLAFSTLFLGFISCHEFYIFHYQFNFSYFEDFKLLFMKEKKKKSCLVFYRIFIYLTFLWLILIFICLLVILLLLYLDFSFAFLGYMPDFLSNLFSAWWWGKASKARTNKDVHCCFGAVIYHQMSFSSLPTY